MGKSLGQLIFETQAKQLGAGKRQIERALERRQAMSQQPGGHIGASCFIRWANDPDGCELPLSVFVRFADRGDGSASGLEIFSSVDSFAEFADAVSNRVALVAPGCVDNLSAGKFVVMGYELISGGE